MADSKDKTLMFAFGARVEIVCARSGRDERIFVFRYAMSIPRRILQDSAVARAEAAASAYNDARSYFELHVPYLESVKYKLRELDEEAANANGDGTGSNPPEPYTVKEVHVSELVCITPVSEL